MFETLTKLLITLAVVWGGYKVLHWTWTSHIDPKATVERFLRQKPKIAEIVATREPDIIYQAGEPVGNVTGKVDITDNHVLFEQITDTTGLNHKEPFEYKRLKLKLVRIERVIGMKVELRAGGSVTRRAVLEDVLCEVLE